MNWLQSQEGLTIMVDPSEDDVVDEEGNPVFMPDVPRFNPQNLASETDFVICLGGDGEGFSRHECNRCDVDVVGCVSMLPLRPACTAVSKCHSPGVASSCVCVRFTFAFISSFSYLGDFRCSVFDGTAIEEHQRLLSHCVWRYTQIHTNQVMFVFEPAVS